MNGSIKKIWGYIAFLGISHAIFAMDIYGLNRHKISLFLEKYGTEIAKFESLLQKESVLIQLNKAPGNPPSKLERQISQQKRHLVEKITKETGYPFVDIDTIFYPEKNTFFSSIEIVENHTPQRLRFINAAPKNYSIRKKASHKSDLIDAMNKFSMLELELMTQHKLSPIPSPCPVYHCFTGFAHPKLKPYLTLFNNGAKKEKKLILDTLHQDNDPARRAAAAFLVGHFPDPHEILTVLTPVIIDPNNGVRNNAMRVITTTIKKAKLFTLDVHPFLTLLDSPYSSDRNKALAVLAHLSQSKASHPLILQQAGNKLVDLFRLQQPNNHDFAYIILKQMSGKDFGPTNTLAWAKWIAAAQHKPT